MAVPKKIQVTKNYRLFGRSSENRPLDIKKHRKLEESLKTYGFLACFPIVCVRDSSGNLVVKDGQHRLTLAESLGLEVYWIEESIDFDVAVVNNTQKTWRLSDYAQKHAANGIKAYQDGLAFAEKHHLTVGTAFSLLAGTVSFNNCEEQFLDGSFKIKDLAWAEMVVGVYSPMVAISPNLRSKRFLDACMRICRVPEFDPARLIQNAERCREKLLSYSTADAFMTMIEHVYNFGRKQLVPLKIQADMAMRDRNIAISKTKKKAQDAA